MNKVMIMFFLYVSAASGMQTMQINGNGKVPEGMVRIFATNAYVDVKKDIVCSIPVFNEKSGTNFFELTHAETEDDIKCAINYALIRSFSNQEQKFVDSLVKLNLRTLARRTTIISKAWQKENEIPVGFELAWSAQLHGNEPVSRDKIEELIINNESLVNAIFELQHQEPLVQSAITGQNSMGDEDEVEKYYPKLFVSKILLNKAYSYLISKWQSMTPANMVTAYFCAGYIMLAMLLDYYRLKK